MDYRSAPPARVVVVRHRPVHPVVTVVSSVFVAVWLSIMSTAFARSLQADWLAPPFVVALLALMLSSSLRSAQLAFDFDRASIVFTLRRWPLSPVRRTILLDEVDRGRVRTRRGPKGSTTYSACILLRSGELIELVPNQGGSMKRADRTVREIDAILGEMRALRV